MAFSPSSIKHSLNLYDKSGIQFPFGKWVYSNAFSVLLALLFIFVLSRVKVLDGVKAVSYLPGLRPLLKPSAFPGALIPTSWLNPGLTFTWNRRFELYRAYGNDCVSVVPSVFGTPGIYTNNLDVARQVTSGGLRSSFIKPESASQAFLIWGNNLFSAEGETWRRHRRIMGPAFDNKLYDRVWEKTLEVYKDMNLSEGWTTKDTTEVSTIQRLTFKATFLVLGECGFGFPFFTWFAPPMAPNGRMSVQNAISVVANSYIFAAAAPKWAWKLPFHRVKEIRTAHEELAEFMHTQVAERKAEVRQQMADGQEQVQRDAFSMLIQANELEAGKLRLDDSELIGNVFIMLLSGHETTAHSLAATLGFLALYEDLQEEILAQIISVVGYEREPTFGDYPYLTKVLSAFYEAIRMYPAVYIMIREASEDTVLNIPNPHGEEGTRTIPIPKGVQVIVDMIGLQNNPRYFDEPEKYKPSRWYDKLNEADAFTGFSVGPRACIGRKFATTESVCFLTMFLREWKIEPLLLEGETRGAWRERVLQAGILLTLGVREVPVRLTRRKPL